MLGIMIKLFRLFLPTFLILFSVGSYSFEYCDLEKIEYLNESKFNLVIEKMFPFSKIEWVDPEYLIEQTPKKYTWVGEGHAGYMIAKNEGVKGLATTGLLTCTGITAFTQSGHLALAHITDLTNPLSVKQFFKEIKVDLKKPVTIIGKTLNDRHLLKIKTIIEEFFDVSPVIKTLPILSYKGKVVTCLKRERTQQLQKDIRGLSFSFKKDGGHHFFFQSLVDQEQINNELKQYETQENEGEEGKLFITPLPYWLLKW
jgi:hypothetical protein